MNQFYKIDTVYTCIVSSRMLNVKERPVKTPPIKKKYEKEDIPKNIIRCLHCGNHSIAYSGNYCSIMCVRESFFGSWSWQDTP